MEKEVPCFTPLVNCEHKGNAGVNPYSYHNWTGWGSWHKYVIAMWFESPYNGTIDSIFLVYYEPVKNKPLPLTLRIFKSNINSHNAPLLINDPNLQTCWGYYKSLYDYDMGITTYRDEATDTQWVKTNSDSTWDPLGEEIWGLGGYPFDLYSNENFEKYSISLIDALGEVPTVTKGESFFICFRNMLPHLPYEQDYAAYFVALPADQQKPGHTWLFHEHENPDWGYCKGWMAHGDRDMGIWYAMALNFPPPVFIPQKEWVTSGKIGNQPINLQLMKFCKPEYLDSADISSVWVDYKFNSGQWDSVQAYTVGDTMFIASIPAQPAGTIVDLNCRTVNHFGVTTESKSWSYRIYGLSQNGYVADTSETFNWIDIAKNEYNILYDKFFLRPDASNFGPDPIDDGTAGPFDLGFDFTFFGSPVRYAWIGVNGGVAFTSSAIDTMHLNVGSYFAQWAIPDTSSPPYNAPKNFVAPFWSDLKLLSNDLSCGSGNIFFKNETNRVIIEWSNLSNTTNDTDCTISFEMILDKRDTSISFLYSDVGLFGFEKTSMVGFQIDSSHWFAFYKIGEPPEYKPHNGISIKFKSTTTVGITEQNSSLPREYSLCQNYPNPFNPVTKIRFQIPYYGFVSLKVYDVFGREVTTLINRSLQPGDHLIEWDAGKMSSGVYFYRLTSGNFTDVKKMVLMK